MTMKSAEADLAALDATAEAALVRAGETSAAELVESVIARIERCTPELNAVIHPRYERARREAAGALPEGPFCGVPFLLKDLTGVEAVHAATRDIAAWWDRHRLDVLVTPTMPLPPAKLGDLVPDPAQPGRAFERSGAYTEFTIPFNVSGQPAISLPPHWIAGGLPIGVRIVGRPNAEDVLLALAARLAEVSPWSQRRPVVWSGATPAGESRVRPSPGSGAGLRSPSRRHARGRESAGSARTGGAMLRFTPDRSADATGSGVAVRAVPETQLDMPVRGRSSCPRPGGNRLIRSTIRRGVALLCALVLSGGCALRMGDLQIISSKNVAVNPEPIQRGVEGKDCVYWLLGLIPLGSLVPNVEEAMDEAMEQVPEGNVLTDVAIYRDAFTVILVSRTCLRVKGDVGRLE